MGAALTVQTGHVALGTTAETLEEVTMNAGDSANVPSFTSGTQADILAIIAGTAAKGETRIRSPRLHDQAQGIRLVHGTGTQLLYAPPDPGQPLYPQDKLIIETSGGASADAVVGILEYYANLPGAEAQLKTAAEVEAHTVNIAGVQQKLAEVAAGGTYSGSQAINADQNTLKANVNYALLGYLTDEDVDIVGVTGPDTGNYRVGGPGMVEPRITARWFIDLSRYTGLPLVPVINAANAGATTIDVASIEAHASPIVSLILAELNI